jgi:unsaturated rhamnogalacturonyl hydrolase
VKRRAFVTGSVSLGGVTSLTGLREADGAALDEVGPSLQKVRDAMLAMQRASWEQGVAAQALLELGEMPLVVLMAKEAVLRQAKDGRLGDLASGDNVTDPGANGEPVLRTAETTGDPRLREAAQRMLEYFLREAPRSADGTVHHIKSRPELWVDSMYMLPPFLAVAGHHAEAVRQVEGYRKHLWSEERKLFSHIWDDGKQAFKRKAFWGVGNGWAAAGMARVIGALPTTMSAERTRLAGYVRETLDGCLALQRPDGLFHDVLDDPSSFVETNLAQMLAYAIFRGVKGGWLDRRYLSAAERMRQAARAKVDAFGLVQGVCGSPHFDRAGTATEGQAFHLLMEAAARA